MFVNKHFANLKCSLSQKVKGVIMRNLRDTIFYMKTNVLQYFHICISVPLSFYAVCFYCMPADHFHFPNIKLFFFKKKEVWNWSLCFIFCMVFNKIFSSYILLTDQIPLSGCLYFVRYWAICIAMVC